MNYAVVGHGRMGRAIDSAAAGRGHLRAAVLGRGARIDGETLGDAEVAFEFTTPETAEANVGALLRAEVGVVCGTTGWEPSPGLLREVEASSAGIVLAPNFSVGMQLFFRVVERAGGLFGKLGLFEPFVHEAHHKGKRDAPSGTARRLVSILAGQDPGRTETDVPVSSLRAGHEPGTHTVGFDGPHDRITLRHAARDRDGFALGAVMAAEWLAGRRGLYSFGDVLDGWIDGGDAQENRR